MKWTQNKDAELESSGAGSSWDLAVFSITKKAGYVNWQKFRHSGNLFLIENLERLLTRQITRNFTRAYEESRERPLVCSEMSCGVTEQRIVAK